MFVIGIFVDDFEKVTTLDAQRNHRFSWHYSRLDTKWVEKISQNKRRRKGRRKALQSVDYYRAFPKGDKNLRLLFSLPGRRDTNRVVSRGRKEERERVQRISEIIHYLPFRAITPVFYFLHLGPTCKLSIISWTNAFIHLWS